MPKGIWKRTERHHAIWKEAMNRPEVIKKIREFRRSQTFSKESQIKKSKTMKEHGVRPPVFYGENHWRWNGGNVESQRIRNRKRKILRLNVFGSHTLGEWLTLKAQYNWTCPACRKKEPEIKLTEDHIIPLTRGGSDNIENIQPLCFSCNASKGNRHMTKYCLMGVGV